MNNTYSPRASSRPTLRGLLGQPEFSIRSIRTLMRLSRMRWSRSQVRSGDPSSTKMTSKSAGRHGLGVERANEPLDAVARGVGRDDDADLGRCLRGTSAAPGNG